MSCLITSQAKPARRRIPSDNVQVYLNSWFQHKHGIAVCEIVGRQHADEHLTPLYCEHDVTGVRWNEEIERQSALFRLFQTACKHSGCGSDPLREAGPSPAGTGDTPTAPPASAVAAPLVVSEGARTLHSSPGSGLSTLTRRRQSL